MKIIIARKKLSSNYNNNYLTIKECYYDALKKEADLLVFGECFFTGYPFFEEYNNEKYLNKALEKLEEIIDLTKGNKTSILLGCPYFIPSYIKDGIKKPKVIYDSMVLLTDGYIQDFVHRKDISKENDFYDYKYFDRGNVLKGFRLCDLNFFTIVNDDIRENRNILLLQDKHADFIMCFDSYLNTQNMEKQIKKLSQFIKKPIIYLNNLGVFNKEKIFDGKVFMTDSKSNFLINSSVFLEDFIEINIIKNNNELLLESSYNIISEDDNKKYFEKSQIFYIKQELENKKLSKIILDIGCENFENLYNFSKQILNKNDIFLISFSNKKYENSEYIDINNYINLENFKDNFILEKVKNLIIEQISINKKALFLK